MNLSNIPWKPITGVLLTAALSMVGTQQYVTRSEAPAKAKPEKLEITCKYVMPKIEIPPMQVFISRDKGTYQLKQE